MELFNAQDRKNEGPLAARMRPRNLDEYIGQDHIVGKGRLLRRAIAADQLSSVIFYGPPGTGKTTLARVIANHTRSNFITLNAVLTGVQHIRDAIAKAEDFRSLYGRKTILFVDEVHRWNKSQQDALLPWVENGTFILVGATTENPFFEVNKALVSRSRVFQLKPLAADDLRAVAASALSDKERGYGRYRVQFEQGALEHLIDTANGDARSLLNALELAVETTPDQWAPDADPCIPPEGSVIYISRETAEESIQRKVVLYDRDGDYHYDIISAFIKSLRGRDPDAAMYWLARMIAAGEDPSFIFRRMIISACEDTGLADPYAVCVVESCAAAFDRVGLPEGRYHLAHAALYLATAPKSNSSMAFFDALSAVEKEDAEVPNHLKDANRDGEGFGHGAGYLYPHAYKDHWVAQQYLPDALAGRVFYTPSDQGYERKIRDDVLSRREMQIAAMTETDGIADAIPDSDWGHASHLHRGDAKTAENLTFSPGGRARDAFQKRIDVHRAESLRTIRDAAVSLASLCRHDRSLVAGADDGLFLWEVWRRTPEGFTSGMCRSEKKRAVLEQYGRTLDALERPALVCAPQCLPPDAFSAADFCGAVRRGFGDVLFDRVFLRDPVLRADDLENAAAFIAELAGAPSARSSEQDASEQAPRILSHGGMIIITQKIPSGTQRLADLLSPLYPEERELFARMKQAEDAFFSGTVCAAEAEKTDDVRAVFRWDARDFAQALRSAIDGGGTAETETEDGGVFAERKTISESRKITAEESARWFDTESSAYGRTLAAELGADNFARVRTLFERAADRTFTWSRTQAFFAVKCR
ncbi:MAG: AAA family ATPase [Bacteroides sp.]|nr:AAA family ATPase [Prevotella sp.]MCM1408416.1 AAA family ATPase [Treponema brennaborense]MCM1469422.1 AAA family ATPase [Bacteroides sp.]